jgi:hypothetical protein
MLTSLVDNLLRVPKTRLYGGTPRKGTAAKNSRQRGPKRKQGPFPPLRPAP